MRLNNQKAYKIQENSEESLEGPIADRMTKFGLKFLTNCWNRPATVKAVTRITRCTITNWRMINNSAVGIWSASSRAWINAFLVDASQVWWAIRAEQALRATVGYWADHIGLATALSLSRHDLTLRVWSARRWIARIRRNRFQRSFLYNRSGNRRYKC